jgi:hypothetical protein
MVGRRPVPGLRVLEQLLHTVLQLMLGRLRRVARLRLLWPLMRLLCGMLRDRAVLQQLWLGRLWL